MKKFFHCTLLITLCSLLFAGCGGGENQPADKVANNFSGDAVKLGMLTPLNSTEDKIGEVLNSIASDTKHTPKFFDSLKLMQMGIEAGNVDAISLYKSVADYVVATNDKFEVVPHDALNKIEYLFCFAVRKDDAALKADLNKIIGEMKSDGALDKLINDYITNVDKGNTPPAVEIPKTDGAEVIKVGITGDLPPLDLILPDNSPAGFNTAMLAEIAKRLNKNIEVVQIESGARATALNSKFIDVVFWAVVPFGNDKIPADIDKPDGVELSDSYFKDSVAKIQLKK